MDYRGLVLIVAGVGLSVFGFQQSAIWGWGNPAIGLCIVAGIVLLVVFYSVERRTESPLMQGEHLRATAPSRSRTSSSAIAMLAFIPVFFFASEYAQIALGREGDHGQPATSCTSSSASWSAPQIGGRMLDRRGQAAGGARLRPGRRRVLPVGREGRPTCTSAPR